MWLWIAETNPYGHKINNSVDDEDNNWEPASGSIKCKRTASALEQKRRHLLSTWQWQHSSDACGIFQGNNKRIGKLCQPPTRTTKETIVSHRNLGGQHKSVPNNLSDLGHSKNFVLQSSHSKKRTQLSPAGRRNVRLSQEDLFWFVVDSVRGPHLMCPVVTDCIWFLQTWHK